MESQRKSENSEKKQKSYTQKELFVWCGLSALATGILGYLIGEKRGERKSTEKYEYAVNTWKSKMDRRKDQEKKKEDIEEEFIM